MPDASSPEPSPSVELTLTAKPATVEDALREVGRIKAFADVLGEHENRVREVFTEAANAHVAAGRETAWSEKLKGVGQAYVTEPEATGRVVDRDAFALWASEHAAGRCQTVKRVNARELERLADANPLVAEYLDELGVLSDETLVAEDLADEVIAGATMDGVDDPTATEGKIINPETGEVIPGLGWRRGTPTLTVKPDKKYRDGIAEELRSRLAPAVEAEASA